MTYYMYVYRERGDLGCKVSPKLTGLKPSLTTTIKESYFGVYTTVSFWLKHNSSPNDGPHKNVLLKERSAVFHSRFKNQEHCCGCVQHHRLEVYTSLPVRATNLAPILRYNIYVRSPRCLGKACCEACPIRLISRGVGISGGCKARLTLKE